MIPGSVEHGHLNLLDSLKKGQYDVANPAAAAIHQQGSFIQNTNSAYYHEIATYYSLIKPLESLPDQVTEENSHLFLAVMETIEKWFLKSVTEQSNIPHARIQDYLTTVETRDEKAEDQNAGEQKIASNEVDPIDTFSEEERWSRTKAIARAQQELESPEKRSGANYRTLRRYENDLDWSKGSSERAWSHVSDHMGATDLFYIANDSLFERLGDGYKDRVVRREAEIAAAKER